MHLLKSVKVSSIAGNSVTLTTPATGEAPDSKNSPLFSPFSIVLNFSAAPPPELARVGCRAQIEVKSM